MYLMFGLEPSRFKDVASDVEFTQKLLAEENVLMLPGQVGGGVHECQRGDAGQSHLLRDAIRHPLPAAAPAPERRAPLELIPVAPQAFSIPNFVRVVVCAPLRMLDEAIARTAEFCARHAADSGGGDSSSDAAGDVVSGASAAPSHAALDANRAHNDGGAAAPAVEKPLGGAVAAASTPVKQAANGGLRAAAAAASPGNITTPCR